MQPLFLAATLAVVSPVVDQPGFGHFAIAVLTILIIDVVLAGDNAVVIALAVRKLQGRQRRLGILAGAGAAVVLRILITSVAMELLSIPGLKLAGGLLILFIAGKLLRDNTGGEQTSGREATGIWQAVWMITLADLTMSLDNILAVAGASHGDERLLVFGLILSIPLVVFASGLLAKLMDRFRLIIYVGAAILGIVGGGMVMGDPWISGLVHPSAWHMRLAEAVGALGVVLASLFFRRQGPTET